MPAVGGLGVGGTVFVDLLPGYARVPLGSGLTELGKREARALCQAGSDWGRRNGDR